MIHTHTHTNKHTFMSLSQTHVHKAWHGQTNSICTQWDAHKRTLPHTPGSPGGWSCLWWASGGGVRGSAAGCSPAGLQSPCDAPAAGQPSDTQGDTMPALCEPPTLWEPPALREPPQPGLRFSPRYANPSFDFLFFAIWELCYSRLERSIWAFLPHSLSLFNNCIIKKY